MHSVHWLVLLLFVSIGHRNDASGVAYEDDLLRDSPITTSSNDTNQKSSDCTSKHVLCKHWAKAGECIGEKKAFMLETCAGSCDPNCEGRVKIVDDSVECKNYSPLCPFWASEGECQSNPTYMMWQCPKVCHEKCASGAKGSGSGNSSNSSATFTSNPPNVKFSIKNTGGGAKSQNESKAGVINNVDEVDSNSEVVQPERKELPQKANSVSGVKRIFSRVSRRPKVSQNNASATPHEKPTTKTKTSTKKPKTSSAAPTTVLPEESKKLKVKKPQKVANVKIITKQSRLVKGRAKVKMIKIRHRQFSQNSNKDQNQ